MKKKAFGIGFLSLSSLLLVAPLAVSGSRAASVAKADAVTATWTNDDITIANDITTRFDSTMNNYVFFTVARTSFTASEAGTDRFWGDAIVTKYAADGTSSVHKCNLTKQTEQDNGTDVFYFQLDCWNGDAYPTEIGERLVINGVAARTGGDYAGDSITLNNITLYHYTSGWTLAEMDTKTVELNAENVTLHSDSNDKWIFFTPDNPFEGSPIGNWSDRLTSDTAVTYTPAGGTSQAVAGAWIIPNDSKVFSFSVATFITNLSVGDVVSFNGTFEHLYSDGLYQYNVTGISVKWNGSNWQCANTVILNYDVDSLSSVSGAVNQGEGDAMYTTLDFEIPADDGFPADSNWAVNYQAADAITITPADGSDPVVQRGVLVKSAATKYVFIWGQWWERYTFQAGDKVTVNGSFTASKKVAYSYTVNFNNITATYDGTGWVTYSADRIAACKAAIAAIGEVTFDAECKARIEHAQELYNKLSSLEVAEITAEERKTISDAVLAYYLLEKEAAGVSVDRVNLTDDDITIPFTAIYDFAVNVELSEPNSMPFDPAWDKYAVKGSHDATIINHADGTEKIMNTYLVKTGEATYVFVFADWANHNGYTFAAGDTVVFDSPSYIYEDEETGSITVLSFPSFSVTYTTTRWLKSAESVNVINCIDLANAIGEVTYDDECRARIDAARAAYDALSSDELSWLPGDVYEIIASAEAEYAELAVVIEAAAVVEKINAIGEVTYDDECKARIDAAREAYEALTETGKSKITAEQLKVLTDAEAAYLDLGYAHAAAEVVALINAIGEVTYDDDCRDRIDAARDAYDELPEEAKAKITEEQLKVLTDAEAAFDQLMAKDNFIKTVATLNENSSLDKIYSTVVVAMVYYNQIEDKTDAEVAAAYATLQTYVQKYNDAVNQANSAHQSALDAGAGLVGAAVAVSTLLAAAVVGRKGF